MAVTDEDWLLERPRFKYHFGVSKSPEVFGKSFMLHVSISLTQKRQKDIWDSTVLLSGSSTLKPWKNEVGFCFVSFQTLFWIMYVSLQDKINQTFFPRNNFCSPSTALNDVFLERNLLIILEKRVLSSNWRSATNSTKFSWSVQTGKKMECVFCSASSRHCTCPPLKRCR